MKTYRGVYHLKDVIKQQDVFLVFSKRRLNCLDVFRHSVEKPHKTCTTQLVSSTVFESSYFIGSSEWKRIQWSTSLNLHSVFDIVLIYFFEELQPFFDKVWSWHVCILTEETKNPDVNHRGIKNESLLTVLIVQPFRLFMFWCLGEKNWF